MNILKKFEKGFKNLTYQRIDSNYKVNIFLGYNDDGNMSMVITEFGKEEKVKSSKFIDVNLKRREDRRLALSFDLTNFSYQSIFILFCKDIIEDCELGKSELAIQNALKRWIYWKEIFGEKKLNLLNKMEIKGLIGELLILQDYFLNNFDEDSAIECWRGPLLGHKDFEINDTWYEVKSISESAIQVNISSLEQLDSDINGHLIIVRLEDTTLVVDNSINLNKIFLSIANKIKNPINRSLFINKLYNVGYVFDYEYDKYCFIYKGTEFYSVEENFPRLTRKKVDSSIGNVSYTILLNGIQTFREV